MNEEKDPKWEIVDELPNEEEKTSKRSPSRSPSRQIWPWIVGGGLAIALFTPFGALIAAKLRALWWVLVGLAIYWYWRRVRGRK